MTDFSKPIGKADDDSIKVIKEALEGKDTHGINIDSIFFNNTEGWVVIEFLKCVTERPHKSHPNRYWNKCWRKVVTLWTITQKLEGQFYWITYEDSREQFSILHFIGINASEHGGITKETRTDTDFNGFKKWYNALNDNPGKLW
jgi:hypothetical protein